MKSPKISIIVPVYNAEVYIRRCIDSILAQTFEDFELILVDDGSPDVSGAICDEYAKNDKRIKVIHKENGGVASARQCGIDNAVGEYTIHADPDDWVEPTMLEELYNKARDTDADMVICDFYVDTDKDSIYKKQEVSSESSKTVLENLLLHRLHGSLCNKLIKLSCYTRYNIGFVGGLNYCEDYLVCVKMLSNKLKIAYVNNALYHYDQFVNEDSITRKITPNTIEQITLFIASLESLFPERRLIIDSNKLDLKFLLFQTGKRKEFSNSYPEVNDKIWEMKTSVINKLLLLLAKIGLFEVAHGLYNFKAWLKGCF